MPKRSLYHWNTFLKRLYRDKKWEEVFFYFRQLVCGEEKPDNFTVPVALKACAGMVDVKYGQMVHGFVKKDERVGFDLFVGSALIEMYAKCGRMADALRVFEEFEKPDVVIWSSMVSGYEKNGFPLEALEFFRRMVMQNVSPDSVTLISLVSSCTQLLSLRLGRCVHGFVMRRGYERKLSLANSLLNLYAKSKSLAAAVNLFKKMPQKNVISWSSMIACYVQKRAANEALCIFNEMMDNGTEPNPITMINILQACAIACDLEQGRKIHELAIRKGVEVEVTVSTALVDMYMKCFSPDEAHDVFSRMQKKDVVSWVTLISGFTKNGMAYKSIEAFSKMLLENTRPDAILMVKILSSSTELGFLEQAVCLHGYIIRSGFDDSPFIGASLVELYSKCGSLDNAVKVFGETNTKDTVVWSSMIAGYGMHGKGDEALQIFYQMVKNSAAKPNHVTFLSILSACSHTGLIQEGLRIFEMMVNDHKVVPSLEHYAILVDLLGRLGELEEAIEIVVRMPISPGPHVWGALLGACRIHQNVDMAQTISNKLFQLDSNHAGYYILLSNMYGLEGEWENMAKLRNLVKNRGIKTRFAQSSIEIRRKIHRFVVDDKLHPEKEGIHGLLKQLMLQMEEEAFPSDEENLSYA